MGLLQNEDFKTETELVSAGGNKNQLLNDPKIYLTGNSINQTLDDAITSYTISQINSLSSITNASSPYSASFNQLILADTGSGDITINLPAVSGNAGKRVKVKKASNNTNRLTVDGNGSDLIDDELTVSSTQSYIEWEFITDGAKWHIV